jgi:hypothetical protein
VPWCLRTECGNKLNPCRWGWWGSWRWTKCFKKITVKNLIISHLAKESAVPLMSLMVHYSVHKWSLLDPHLSQIMRRHLSPKSTGKPTHTAWYLIFNSKYLLHVKRFDSESLHNRASTICHQRQDLLNEISSLRHDLQVNGYPPGFIKPVINSKSSGHLNKEQKLFELKSRSKFYLFRLD